jgi:NAD/NADP transhydrogenase alpha subunit
VTVVAFFELLGRLFASSLDAVWGSSSPATVIALVGVVGAFGLVALVAAARLGGIVALSDSLRFVAGLERPVEPADRALLLSQSDPDADGRPRPRAPGFLLQTA